MLHKLEDQRRVLERIADSEEVRRTIEACIDDVGGASNLDAIRIAESIAAARYWECWSDVEVRFPRAELTAVPQHWLRFGTRASAIANGPRLAVNPANAVLNCLYRLLEVETRLALFVAGLDPGIGIVHLDQRGRDSLALDAMEAARPQVDAFALDLFEGHVFTRTDFTELATGHCRIGPDLARTLADTMPRWATAIGPVVEEIAKMLLEASGSTERLPTRLSQTNRSRGREGIRREERRQPRPPKVRLATACERCGAPTAKVGRRLCGPCLAADQAKRAQRFARAGRDALLRLRAEGRDPAAAPEVRAKMHATKERTHALDRAWNAEHREKPDPDIFFRDVLPRIQGVPLRRLAEVTGLSFTHCGQIRRGLKVPHPRHWEALRALGLDSE